LNKVLFASIFVLFFLVLLPNVSAQIENSTANTTDTTADTSTDTTADTSTDTTADTSTDTTADTSTTTSTKEKTLSGWHVIGISIAIVLIGILMHTVLGAFRSRATYEKEKAVYDNLDAATQSKVPEPVNPGIYDVSKFARSAIVGSITGLILVLPQVQRMTESNPVDNLILALTLVATVAGIDAIAKKAGLGKK